MTVPCRTCMYAKQLVLLITVFLLKMISTFFKSWMLTVGWHVPLLDDICSVELLMHVLAWVCTIWAFSSFFGSLCILSGYCKSEDRLWWECRRQMIQLPGVVTALLIWNWNHACGSIKPLCWMVCTRLVATILPSAVFEIKPDTCMRLFVHVSKLCVYIILWLYFCTRCQLFWILLKFD